MLKRPCYSKEKGAHYGYGWCGGMCRWGTTGKIKSLDAYAEQLDAKVYIGIAADETARLEKSKKPYKLHPLAEFGGGMTESDCINLCRSRGWAWLENDVDLYNILSRVSCWCCCNKN